MLFAMKTQSLADINIFAGDGKPELPGQWVPELELGNQGKIFGVRGGNTS